MCHDGAKGLIVDLHKINEVLVFGGWRGKLTSVLEPQNLGIVVGLRC